MPDLYRLFRVTLDGYQLTAQRPFASQREACLWHIEKWKKRTTSNALILRGPDGRRYSFNDSVGVAANGFAEPGRV